MRVFITGGTGLVGRRLIRQLRARRDEVVCLTRDAARAREILPADVQIIGADPALVGPWQDRLLACDAVVNLAGESVGEGRWSRQKKSRIRRSRLAVTGHIATVLARSERPAVLVNASAVGYYGDQGATALGEDHEPGHDFLARLAVEWEHTASKAATHQIRVVMVRIGVVLAPEGGALARMVPMFKLGMGGPLGSGRQYFPWIHAEDLVQIILFSLDNDQVRGPLNAVAPDPPLQKEFAAALGRAVGKSAWLPTPGLALKILLGEKADLLLASQRATPNLLKAAGFRFRFGELDKALGDLLPA